MKSTVFVFLLSTLVILEVSCQRCGLFRGCGDNQCCALLPPLGRQCQNLGETGERCGLGFTTCPCVQGLTCLNFRCEDMRMTTTEEQETTTEEETTTTEETTTEEETTTAEETTAEEETTTAEETTAEEETTTAEETTSAEETTTTAEETTTS